MPSLIPFDVSHLKDIELRDLDKQIIMSIPNSTERIVIQSQSGMAYTGVDGGGNIIIIGGVSLLWPHVGSAWSLTSDLIVKYKIWTHRITRDFLDTAIKVYSLHRIESIILKNHNVSRRWAERLGFQREGLLRKYDSQGNDYWLYARVI